MFVRTLFPISPDAHGFHEGSLPAMTEEIGKCSTVFEERCSSPSFCACSVMKRATRAFWVLVRTWCELLFGFVWTSIGKVALNSSIALICVGKSVRLTHSSFRPAAPQHAAVQPQLVKRGLSWRIHWCEEYTQGASASYETTSIAERLSSTQLFAQEMGRFWRVCTECLHMWF